MKNDNESNIISKVEKMERGFLSGYYTASMYELRQISKQESFSDAEKKHLERVFMLPNDGAIDVYFTEKGKMNIATRTPSEQENYKTQISRVSYLIKNGYSNIDTTSEHMESIIRYLNKENIEIINLIEKGSLALITINNENYNLMSINSKEEKLSKIENEEVLFAEDKIITSKQLQESFDSGNKTLTINTIKQLQKRNSFTKYQKENLTNIYRLPNKSAVEIYFKDNSLFFEERNAKEQELHDIQIERLKSLMYGEIDKLSLLSKYHDMAIRFLNKNNIKIKSVKRVGVFYEFKVKPIIKVVENDLEIAKKRKREDDKKLKKQQSESVIKEQQRQTVRTVEKRQASRPNIRERMQKLQGDENFLTDLSEESVVANENAIQSARNTPVESSDKLSAQNNDTSNLSLNKADNEQLKGTMQTTMQTIQTPQAEKDEAAATLNQSSVNIAQENSFAGGESFDNNTIAVKFADDNFNSEEVNAIEKGTKLDEHNNLEQKETNHKAVDFHDEESLKLFNEVEILNVDKNKLESTDNSDDFTAEFSDDNSPKFTRDSFGNSVAKQENDVPSENYESPQTSEQNVVKEEEITHDYEGDNGSSIIDMEPKFVNINLDDKEQLSKTKTDVFWKLQWLRVKENVNLDELEKAIDNNHYDLISTIYNAFKKASVDNSPDSETKNESGQFYNLAQLCRIDIMNYLERPDDDSGKKIVSALLSPIMDYSRTEEFNELIDNFLHDPKIKFEMKNALTNLDEVISNEILDQNNNRIQEAYDEFVKKHPVNIIDILNSN